MAEAKQYTYYLLLILNINWNIGQQYTFRSKFRLAWYFIAKNIFDISLRSDLSQHTRNNHNNQNGQRQFWRGLHIRFNGHQRLTKIDRILQNEKSLSRGGQPGHKATSQEPPEMGGIINASRYKSKDYVDRNDKTDRCKLLTAHLPKQLTV